MKTEIGITAKNRQLVATELSKILSDETVLYTKTKNAHWNFEGPDFYDKHKFFEIQFGQLDEIIDNVAERIRSIGYPAPGTLKLFLSLTRLKEAAHSATDGQGLIQELLKDHERIIVLLRAQIETFSKAYQDAGSSDFITGLVETHEKMSWFLRSHLST